MDTNPTIGEIVGVDSLCIAKIATDTVDAYTADAVGSLAPTGEVKHDPKADAAVSYYDNGPLFAYPYEGEAEETVGIPGLSEQKFAELTGKSFDPTTGAVYDSGDPIYSPYYALGYHIPVGNGYDKYRWFLKGLFVPSSEDYKTKGSKVDPQGLSVTYKPLRTIHKWAIPDPRNAAATITTGLKVMKADTSSAAFTSAGSWFSRVQTPDSFGKPAALALSLVDPTNNKTGVLAGIKPTLTFNNPIASDSVLLLKSDGTVVAMAESYDTAGKVITISPLVALTAGAEYQLVVSGVKDVYGQTLAPTVISFTVAS